MGLDNNMKSKDERNKDLEDKISKKMFIKSRDVVNNKQNEKSEINVLKDYITREDKLLQELDKIDVSEYTEVTNGNLKYNGRTKDQKDENFISGILEDNETKFKSKINFYEIVEDTKIPSNKETIKIDIEEDTKDLSKTILEDDKASKLIGLLNERIESLENMFLDLLKLQPSKRLQDIFILEKHMFNLKKNTIENSTYE